MSEESTPVGPIVGPISNSQVADAAQRYFRNGAMYDIALGGLPFVKAPSDERPYARETADFKKTQVDQAPTAGDQSLVGYWTRGQQSFHRGGGVTYYEILDGEGVLNRFKDSLDVDTWTPGKVTLKKVLGVLSTDDVVDAVPFTFDGDPGVVTLNNTGGVEHVSFTGTVTALATSTGLAATGIASDGENVYASVDDSIEILVPAGAPTTFSILWDHGVGGRTFAGVWWAKDRIWAVDNTGEWYTLSTAGGTTSGGDVLWTSLKDGNNWSLSDSEGGVFVARGSTVFLSSLDLSTPVPTLSVPSAVASVGAQETISTIGSYLGYLVVCSQRGIRVGRIQGTQVLLGAPSPLVDASMCNRVGYRDSLVLVTASGGDVAPSDKVSLWELNLTDQVTDLAPAFARVREFSPSTTAEHGSVVLQDGRVLLFSNDGLLLEDDTDLVSTGFVQTGLHRFGTLEPKDFRTLTVRAEGTAGTVAVSVVTASGATQSLLTLSTQHFADNTISLNQSRPGESLALRFDLAPGSGVSPTLLGYQLRALPAPKRQRLIQVPLLCFDVERIGKQDFGFKGWATGRLFELEVLETASTVLTFQDFNTGESQNVSIEKVQFQSRTPQSGQTSGFGGFLVVTMRTVD